MLIPILANKLPCEIRLELSWKLRKDNWKIAEFIGCFEERPRIEMCFCKQNHFIESSKKIVYMKKDCRLLWCNLQKPVKVLGL